MKSLVFFALSQEAAPFRRTVAHGSHCQHVVTGVGPVNAQSAAQRAIAQHHPEVVYTCGYAGGLDPALARYAILFEAPPDFVYRQRLLDLGAVPGRFAMADRVLTTASEKRLWRANTQADAIEMESGAIHRVCADFKIPCATVRIISDTAMEDLPIDFNALMTRGSRMNYFKLTAILMGSPGKIKELLVFQAELRKGARLLSEFLVRLVDMPDYKAISKPPACRTPLT